MGETNQNLVDHNNDIHKSNIEYISTSAYLNLMAILEHPKNKINILGLHPPPIFYSLNGTQIKLQSYIKRVLTYIPDLITLQPWVLDIINTLSKILYISEATVFKIFATVSCLIHKFSIDNPFSMKFYGTVFGIRNPPDLFHMELSILNILGSLHFDPLVVTCYIKTTSF
jgi:hypothetical protein